MRTLINALTSFFYPKTCIICNKPLLPPECQFCLYCIHELPETNFHTIEHPPTSTLFDGRIQVEQIFTFLYYQKGGASQKILQNLKYFGNKELGELLGIIYATKLKEKLTGIETLIPVPLHSKKLRQRGYNQSECIARGISKATKIPINTQLLKRTQYTETQTQKNRYSRWENVEGKFSVDREYITESRHYLVIDDVLTTGATIEAAASKLLAIRNAKVSVLTLAITY